MDSLFRTRATYNAHVLRRRVQSAPGSGLVRMRERTLGRYFLPKAVSSFCFDKGVFFFFLPMAVFSYISASRAAISPLGPRLRRTHRTRDFPCPASEALFVLYKPVNVRQSAKRFLQAKSFFFLLRRYFLPMAVSSYSLAPICLLVPPCAGGTYFSSRDEK